MAEQKTRAERLAAIVRKVAPKTAAYHDEHAGAWPKRTIGGREVAQAPYEFEDRGGRKVLRVYDDDGDLAAKGVGATHDEAIADIEKKAEASE